jgi:uncharacterized repeat protein (TIGR01451 family)
VTTRQRPDSGTATNEEIDPATEQPTAQSRDEVEPEDEAHTDTTDSPAPASWTLRDRRETRRWTGIAGIALLAGGIGIVTTSPALLLASAIGVGMLAVVRAADPTVPELAVERRFEPADPDPGEHCTVTVTVTNAGEQTIADLRLLDLVPEALAVVDGSPRAAVTLRPGEETELSYTLAMRRGYHEFEGLLGLTRGMTGAVELETMYDATDDIACTPHPEPVDTLALRALTTPYAGRQTTDSGGAGIEFYSTREYLPGDPIRHIDWNRHARSGELATLEFRTERAASVVLVADVRAAAYVQGDEQHGSAADRGVDALGRLFGTLLDNGDQAGIATLGPECHWLPPRLGTDHRVRGRELLGEDPMLSPTATEESMYPALHVRRLRERLPADAQVIVATPLCDDDAAEIVRLLDAHGHDATVISPDPTRADTPGRRLARAERRLRMAALRHAGIRVVDWQAGESLDTAIARARKRWSG